MSQCKLSIQKADPQKGDTGIDGQVVGAAFRLEHEAVSLEAVTQRVLGTGVKAAVEGKAVVMRGQVSIEG
jgi:hypothetical protein